MSKPTAWMPMYWGDYLRDTRHLSTEEHGAYLLLIAHYWSTGRALPDDPEQLQNICQLSAFKFKKYLPALSAFFKVENGRWYHERIERELIAAFENKAAAVRRGKRGAAARWDRPSMLAPSVKHSSSPSPSTYHESSLSESHTDAAREPAPDGEAPARAQASLVPERPPGTESPEARDIRLRLAEITAAKRAAFLRGR